MRGLCFENTMDDLKTKIEQAGEELRSIRGYLNIVKSIPAKRSAEKAMVSTFPSIPAGKDRGAKRQESDTLENQFTKFSELDHFVFSN